MLDRCIQRLEKNSKKCVLLFFALLFVYGCIAAKDYGITTDDGLQRRHSLVMYDHLFLKGEDYHTPTANSQEIKSFGMVAYGATLQLPLVFLEHINNFSLTYQQIFIIRHYYSFLWFFISAIFFYRIAMILTEGRRLEALLGTVIYVLCPRTLADSFYNIKDGLCMALFTISIFYGIRLIQKLSLKNVFPFVLFAALCTVSRIVGGVVVAAVVFVVFMKHVCERKWKILFEYCILVSLLFVGMFILVSPNVWKNIPASVLRIIQVFSNYDSWDSSLLYMGEWVRGTELPWHYLFVWIGMTVPAVYLALMALGLKQGGAYCVQQRKRLSENKNRGWVYLALFLTMIIPFLYVVIVRPVLYDGWRHFYFMYSVIACWAVLGLHTVFCPKRKKQVKYGCTVVLVCVFAYLLIWIGKNHPYEYVYYNPWIRTYAADNFLRDYWFVSEKDALQYILDTNGWGTIRVYSERDFTWMFADEEKKLLQYAPSAEGADYAITGGYDFQDSYLFEKEKDIMVDKIPIRSIYKRAYDIVKDINFTLKESDALYELNGIHWSDESTKTERIYVGKLTEMVETDRLAVLTSDEDAWEEEKLTVYVSNDGENWFSLEEESNYSRYKERISVECVTHNLNYIKLVYTGELTEDLKIRLIMCQYGETIGGDGTGSNPTVVALDSNVKTSMPLYAMVDGNTGTRWETSSQEPGMRVDVTLDNVYRLCGVTLNLGESPWDYPRNLKIYVSLDAGKWDEVEALTEDNESYTFEPVDCKYLRFELGEAQEEVRVNWSIYELQLFTMVE